jgi:RNA polymerase-associated protein RTF1
VRNALIEEQRQRKLERRREMERKKKEEEAARRKAEEEKAAQEARADLFGDDSKPASQRDTPKPVEKEQSKGLPTFRKPKLDDDIIASLDIGVDIEI